MQAQPTKARRTRVARHPGVYYREGADGRRSYEISYTDSTGRRRWRVVGTSLRDAVAAREELRSRVRRGERVAPSRATLAEVAEAWLAAQTQLRPKTREVYETHLRVHILPQLGRLRVAEIDEDDVVRLIREMQEAGRAAWTIRGALTPLRGALNYAVRRGMIGSNPVSRLERGERPAAGRREQRILDAAEIGRLIAAAAPRYRALLATESSPGCGSASCSRCAGRTWISARAPCTYWRSSTGTGSASSRRRRRRSARSS